MKIFNKVFEFIISPYIFFIKANVKPDPNKYVRPVVVFAISIVIVTALVFLIYRGVIFK